MRRIGKKIADLREKLMFNADDNALTDDLCDILYLKLLNFLNPGPTRNNSSNSKNKAIKEELQNVIYFQNEIQSRQKNKKA